MPQPTGGTMIIRIVIAAALAIAARQAFRIAAARRDDRTRDIVHDALAEHIRRAHRIETEGEKLARMVRSGQASYTIGGKVTTRLRDIGGRG